MCGIVGFVDCRNAQRDVGFIERMIHALNHRGPDSTGTWIDRNNGIFIGHTRLSILDLSPLGHQPMMSSSNRYVITFNGEIYNFQVLRSELIANGFRPKSSSDTEVILGLLDEYGIEKTLKKLNGMFSIAIWDQTELSLTLARDKFGEKPLYYGWNGSNFFFASELKAICAHPDFNGVIDEQALSLMLTYSYIPAPYSAYLGIYKLPQSSYMTLHKSDLKSRPSSFSPISEPESNLKQPIKYWDLRSIAINGQLNSFSGKYEDALNELESLLLDSVRMRMISDVPLGAFLSGGVDSSLVVSLMQKASKSPVKTFSIGFIEDEYNEAHHAMKVARHLGTQHYELYVTHKESLDVIPLLPSMYDEPFADSSQIPTYLVSKLARQHVTVSLTGDGGDEIFGGYRRYAWANNFSKLLQAPTSLRHFARSALTCISPSQWTSLSSLFGKLFSSHSHTSRFGHRMHRFADILQCKNYRELYLLLISHWPDGEILSSRKYAEYTPYHMNSSWLESMSLKRKLMFLDQITYLPDDILVKVDRAAMAVSLEGRIPLLDPNVVEFAWSLPDDFLFDANGGKRILKDLLSRYVPREFFSRPKMGFGVPIENWLKNELKDWVEDLISPKALNDLGIFETAPIQKRWKDFLSGLRPWDQHIWDVLMIQSWVKAQKGLGSRHNQYLNDVKSA